MTMTMIMTMTMTMIMIMFMIMTMTMVSYHHHDAPRTVRGSVGGCSMDMWCSYGIGQFSSEPKMHHAMVAVVVIMDIPAIADRLIKESSDHRPLEQAYQSRTPTEQKRWRVILNV